MTSRYWLSFCIPTYNFGQFIRGTLDSIIAQAVPGVQIVIVDGGSKDDTAAIVADVARGFPHIEFVEQTTNRGVDRDILETVEQADGEYCWLFSADDLLAPGAIARIAEDVKTPWDVFMGELLICDKDMNALRRSKFLRVEKKTLFDWRDETQRRDYFSRAATTTAFFSFISNLVIKKSSWQSVPVDERFIGGCWIIAAKLLALGRRGMTVCYDPEISVHKRGDNDSFLSRGLVWRTEISLRGFRDIPRTFFGPDSFEAANIARVLGNEYTLSVLLNYKRIVLSQYTKADFDRFVELVKYHYGSDRFGDRVAWSIFQYTPNWVVRIGASGYHVLAHGVRRAFHVLNRGSGGQRRINTSGS